MQQIESGERILFGQEEPTAAHGGNARISGHGDEAGKRVDGLGGPEYPAAAGELENGRPVAWRLGDQVGAVRRNLCRGIRRQPPLVSEVLVALVGAPHRLGGQNRQVIVIPGAVKLREETVLRRERDVRVVDDQQVVVLHQSLDRMVGERLQRPKLPPHLDVGMNPPVGLRRGHHTSVPPRVLPGHPAKNGGHGAAAGSPNSARTLSVCWPRRGDGREPVSGSPSMRIGLRVVVRVIASAPAIGSRRTS